jgi:hypothetical protein
MLFMRLIGMSEFENVFIKCCQPEPGLLVLQDSRNKEDCGRWNAALTTDLSNRNVIQNSLNGTKKYHQIVSYIY